jgi:hypothetical protein
MLMLDQAGALPNSQSPICAEDGTVMLKALRSGNSTCRSAIRLEIEIYPYFEGDSGLILTQ